MDVQYKENGIVEIDGRIRIEPGPRLLTGTATPELLSDAVTAAHYRAPFQRPATQKDGDSVIVFNGERFIVGPGGGDEVRDVVTGQLKFVTQYSVDALGKPIILGQPMTYADWKSKWKNGGPEAAWNVYALEDPDGPGELVARWNKKGIFETQALAMSAATTLAVEVAGTPAPKDPVPVRTRRRRQ